MHRDVASHSTRSQLATTTIIGWCMLAEMGKTVLDLLADQVRDGLSKLVSRPPARKVILEVLDVSLSASLRQEEGRFVRGTLTYADPNKPQEFPVCVRSNYPKFVSLGAPERLTVDGAVKLARAVDAWTGSIAIFRVRQDGLVAWGILDQQVHANTWRLQESDGTFGPPGVFSVRIDGPGDLSVFHGTLLLGSLRGGKLASKESSPMTSPALRGWFVRFLGQRAVQISRELEISPHDAAEALFHEWKRTLWRLCVTVRRAGTGGAFLLTPHKKELSIHRSFGYSRLAESIVFGVVDQRYQGTCEERVTRTGQDQVATQSVLEYFSASAQASDRQYELTGAVKLVASLATLDGAVVMQPDLTVVGFGAKLEAVSTLRSKRPFDGQGFTQHGARAKRIDGSRFGTRHKSMFQYCAAHKDSVGVVISQDGTVRLVMTAGRSLLMWDAVKVENYRDDQKAYARQAAAQAESVRRAKKHHPATRGFGPMPKTLEEMAHRSRTGSSGRASRNRAG